jgi:N-acetyl-gamma-glutamyl-phosphate reductase
MINIAILGATGYTGVETLRLAFNHPEMNIVALTSEGSAGKSITDSYPHLKSFESPKRKLPPLTRVLDTDFQNVQAVFCCLPHATTQSVVKGLPSGLKVIDLSADFRLNDATLYEKWYGHPHQALELQKNAVYGLSEINRDAIKRASLVANPGCYPTSAQLPLIPLLKAGLIKSDGIIIDAKSGVSGAGRTLRESSLFCEVNDSMSAYGVGTHRHTPEIEQGLSMAAGHAVNVVFTPHLAPMSRGIISTIYVESSNGAGADDLKAKLEEVYGSEKFVKILSGNLHPATRHVYGTNYCLINVFESGVKGRMVIVSVIDNLVKGASGQAVHNFNLMYGFAEDTGLSGLPVVP